MEIKNWICKYCEQEILTDETEFRWYETITGPQWDKSYKCVAGTVHVPMTNLEYVRYVYNKNKLEG